MTAPSIRQLPTLPRGSVLELFPVTEARRIISRVRTRRSQRAMRAAYYRNQIRRSDPQLLVRLGPFQRLYLGPLGRLWCYLRGLWK